MATGGKRGRKVPPRARRKMHAPGKSENAGLKQQLAEARAQQAATAAILKVIARSPSDVQPVFDAIVKSARQLLGGLSAAVARLDGEAFRLAAFTTTSASGDRALKRIFPIPVAEGFWSKVARAGTPIYVRDVEVYPSLPPGVQALARARGFRSLVFVPMLHGSARIGTLSVTHKDPGSFTGHQIELLKTFANQAVIAIENVRLFKELEARNRDVTEALERQTATAEILKVIASSPSDVQPVLDAVAQSAARLCAATDAVIHLRDGEMLRMLAHFGEIVTAQTLGDARPMKRGFAAGRAALEGRQLHIHDVQSELVEFPESAAMARQAGHRTMLLTPLMREGVALGTISIRRTEVNPFTEKQIDLLNTFASQAVIAIENVRLFNETRESLERQTATAEILRVIASSPSDVQPVFDAIASSALRLIGAFSASVMRVIDESLHLVALTSTSETGDEALRKMFPAPLSSRRGVLAEAVRRKAPVSISDTESDPRVTPRAAEMARARGYRGLLTVPMIRESEVIGTISVTRREPGAFTEHQIGLLKTFADQAVIAIENVRLFNETKEALAQRTATAEILRVIAGSQSDVQPVLDAVAESAARVCEASDALIQLRQGDILRHAAHYGELKTLPAGASFPISREIVSGRAVLEGRQIHVLDMHAEQQEYPASIAIAREHGFRTILMTPLMREGTAIGAISIRRTEVRAFSDKQIALVRTFADQAVIAIENVRLFNETREALERQTATAEILRVIASSPSDVQPVFEVIADTAMRLLKAFGASVFTYDGEMLHFGAACGGLPDSDESVRSRYPMRPGPGLIAGNCIFERRPLQRADSQADPDPMIRQIARERGYRAILAVPMLRNGEPIGTIVVTRQDPGAFPDAAIALLQTFADQAVIAIENVRLFNETREALEKQTATSEILRVISSSPTDVQPVFDTIVRNGMQLCGGERCALIGLEGATLKMLASHNYRPEDDAALRSVYPRPLSGDTGGGRAILEQRVIQIADVTQVADYSLKDVTQVRSVVAVPMVREGVAIGALVVGKLLVGKFSDDHVKLLQTFTDQALIAIENVRLFNETKEALERQTATAEILKVIASSPSDVQPVLDTVAENAARLCEAIDAVIFLKRDELLCYAAHYGPIPVHPLGTMVPVTRGMVAGRAILEARQIHVLDLQAEGAEFPEASANARKHGYHTNFSTPLLREGTAIGVISIRRAEARPFIDKQIALLQTFADQAVIAIENVRLFNETKEALEQQTATSEILRVISGSLTDTQPVFDAIVQSAVRLFQAGWVRLFLVEGDRVSLRARHGPGTFDADENTAVSLPIHESAVGQAILKCAAIQFPDFEAAGVSAEVAARNRAFGIRSTSIAPLIRDGKAIGAITVPRSEPGLLSEKQMALLRTFADQAVIAIENVRLFNETKDALERQTATAEILKVIASSPSDVQPVFDAIVQSAARLFGRNARIRLVQADGLNLRARTDGDSVEDVPEPTVPIDRNTNSGRVTLERRAIQVADTRSPDAPRYALERYGRLSYRSIAGAPLMRDNTVIGVLNVTGSEPGELSEKQMALLQTFADQAVIAIENVRLFKELEARNRDVTNALERQTATAEILASMSESMTDARPVFDAIVRNLLRLFGTRYAAVQLLRDGRIEMAALHGEAGFERMAEHYPRPLDDGTAGGMVMRSGQVLQLTPVVGNPATPPDTAEFGRAFGFDSLIAAPMVREDKVVGAIITYRRDPVLFDDRQVALLKSFADQAVIAIENVRLFNETKEALERQTATAGILRVISGSPTNVQPVFDTILEQALQLCQASFGWVCTSDGNAFDIVAQQGLEGEVLAAATAAFRETRIAGPATALGRMRVQKRPIHIPDAKEEPVYQSRDPRRVAIVELAGARTMLAVPLLRDGAIVGALLIYRREVRPFAERQIALLQTFADQAVIAIENVRLFNETKEALERQTATAEILKVISGSPTDTQPVFDAIASSCVRLFGGQNVALVLVRDQSIELAAFATPSEFVRGQFPESFPLPISEQSVSGRAILTRSVVHVPDMEADPLLGERAKSVGRRFGYRDALCAPMIRDDRAIGAIAVVRSEPETYTEKQIGLLTTFANQAVIAIENVRLFRELEARNREVTETLERQTATGEILGSMSGSMTDTAPVFDAIVRNLLRLFGSQFAAVFLLRDGRIEVAAHRGEAGFEAILQSYPRPLDGHMIMSKVFLEKQALQMSNLSTNPDAPPGSAELARRVGYESIVAAPMIREGQVIGGLAASRRNPAPFDEKQIELLQSFANQAVIAIENVRLFNETKESLERQTATAEILQVIAASPSDVQPVFDAILDSATRLCEGHFGILGLYDGDSYKYVAHRGSNAKFAKWVVEKGQYTPQPGGGIFRMTAERQPIHIADVREAAAYRDGNPVTMALADIGGVRTYLSVPMLRDDRVIGGITIYRPEVKPFTAKQIELVSIFASQAVIAIENVRLFNETREALERQTATAEILKVIASSPSDVQPVFATIAERAAKLIDSPNVTVLIRDGEGLRVRVTYARERGIVPPQDGVVPIKETYITGRAVLLGRTSHIEDVVPLLEKEYPGALENQSKIGYRTVLAVPMIGRGGAIGVIYAWRREARKFSTEQVALLESFADQAVIAIENVRLFNETKEALERQTATAEILKVISSSPTDVQPVFDAIVNSAARLFECSAAIQMREGQEFHLNALANWRGDQTQIESLRRLYPFPFEPEASRVSRALQDGAILEVPDIDAAGAPRSVARVGHVAGFRAAVNAPLLRADTVVGMLSLTWADAGHTLDEKQRGMLRTFADQAVIAIENVRLFNELRERTQALTKSVDQLTALGEVGQAISSTLDLETVLKTIVSHAVQLTGLDAGAIFEYDERAEEFCLRAAENMGDEVLDILRSNPIRKGDGAVGGTAVTREPIQVPETQDESYRSQLRDLMIRTGRRALLAVPLLHEDHIIGALAVQRSTPGPFAPEVVELLKTFATQSAMAIQNARLFREIAEKGRQLEEASQHKSQFLASMSHELRTPLNAILGFNEMILGDVYGEVPGDMQPPLAQMQTSGKHLLRLINNVLDLAKIEAGRMELALSDYSVHDTVASVHSTLRGIADDKGLEFLATVPNDVPLAYGDGGRMAQCLMNLAGNSLKFTKAGKVEISAGEKDGLLTYRVTDTGVGIPPDKIGSLFTEFKQTDATIASEYGGTGLGLSISKKFVEMHGGRIWVESELGKGSEFIIEIPLRVKTP